jgi:hypothetical protein
MPEESSTALERKEIRRLRGQAEQLVRQGRHGGQRDQRGAERVGAGETDTPGDGKAAFDPGAIVMNLLSLRAAIGTVLPIVLERRDRAA